MDKPLQCPKCGAPLVPMGRRLPSFLVCLICGLAVRTEDAEDRRRMLELALSQNFRNEDLVVTLTYDDAEPHVGEVDHET